MSTVLSYSVIWQSGAAALCSPCDPMHCTRLLCPWNFRSKNTGVGYHFLLQGIFPTQGSNLVFLHLLHWQVDSLLTNPMEGEPLPEKHNPMLSGTGHNTQAFTPQSHSQIASSIFKKSIWCKEQRLTFVQEIRVPVLMFLLAYEMALIRPFP